MSDPMHRENFGETPPLDTIGDDAPGAHDKARRAAVAAVLGVLALLFAAAYLTEGFVSNPDCGSINEPDLRLKCYDATHNSALQPARGAMAPRTTDTK